MERFDERSEAVQAGDTPVMHTPVACVLAAIGFACLTAWGTYMVFVPTLPLLSFASIAMGIECLLLSRLVTNGILIVCIRHSDYVFNHLRRLLFPGLPIVYAPAFAFALLAYSHVITVNSPSLFAAWMWLGVGDMALSLTWVVLLSLMPARWTALVIAAGGALATPLFLLVGSVPGGLMGVLGAVFLVATSGTLAYYLFKRVNTATLVEMQRYQHRPTITFRAALSVAVHGLVYGYVTVMLCLIGLRAVLIAAAAGLVGSLLALVWARGRTKSRWDTAAVQRATIPIVVAVLLLIPFLDETGRVVCGAIAIGTFAYATLMEWTELVVTNAEFQLFPVRRHACTRLAQWTGFLLGACIAFVAFCLWAPSQEQLMLLSVVIAIVVVAVFSIYGADDSQEKNEYFNVMTGSEVKLEEASRNPAPFRERCEALIKQYNLTPREAEVFMCLAKGRNSEYIQQTLYISGNTAKTHICHIYQKLGIGSQQRLIDLVDAPQEVPDSKG